MTQQLNTPDTLSPPCIILTITPSKFMSGMAVNAL